MKSLFFHETAGSARASLLNTDTGVGFFRPDQYDIFATNITHTAALTK
jgi:hypothetical protein